MPKLFAGPRVSSWLAPLDVVGASGWRWMAGLPTGLDLPGGFASSDFRPLPTANHPRQLSSDCPLTLVFESSRTLRAGGREVTNALRSLG